MSYDEIKLSMKSEQIEVPNESVPYVKSHTYKNVWKFSEVRYTRTTGIRIRKDNKDKEFYK